MVFRRTVVLASVVMLLGCSTAAERAGNIPMHVLSIGMSKANVTAKLGVPHRVALADTYNGGARQVWVYQQDKVVWLTGNSFIGGTTQNERTTYLLAFMDDTLVAWKDAALQRGTKEDNIFEFRQR